MSCLLNMIYMKRLLISISVIVAFISCSTLNKMYYTPTILYRDGTFRLQGGEVFGMDGDSYDHVIDAFFFFDSIVFPVEYNANAEFSNELRRVHEIIKHKDEAFKCKEIIMYEYAFIIEKDTIFSDITFSYWLAFEYSAHIPTQMYEYLRERKGYRVNRSKPLIFGNEYYD